MGKEHGLSDFAKDYMTDHPIKFSIKSWNVKINQQSIMSTFTTTTTTTIIIIIIKIYPEYHWKVELIEGGKCLAVVKIQRGISQGDALSPLLKAMMQETS